MTDKDKDTKEVTTRPYRTTVEDAPDNAGPVSQKVLDEQAAGRDALKDAGGPHAGPGPINPADADPALAAELADRINRENEWRKQHPPTEVVPPGVTPPDQVPSRGIPAGGVMPGDELAQGTPSHRTVDERLTDPNTPEGQQAEGRKQAQERERERADQARKQQDDTNKKKK
jgi:hypothetical protein